MQDQGGVPGGYRSGGNGAVWKKEEMDEPEKAAEPEKTGFRVLAVTACPTGIAHTYMAAENLEIQGKNWGFP